jgi:hypothetical protein
MIDNLAICISFHYSVDRLTYLRQIASHFSSLASRVQVHIITNTPESHAHEHIARVFRGVVEFSIKVPELLGHPYLLTWSHLAVFRDLIESNLAITHFMYVEDDICVTRDNIDYWLKAREELRGFGAIPSFLRIEFKDEDPLPYSTDVVESASLGSIPQINIRQDYAYINLLYPYQGMYLLDRELMVEHLSGPSCSPDHGIWNIREKAAQGLTFSKVPRGFNSRNFVGFDLRSDKIDKNSLVQHLPNNYANNPNTKHGKISIDSLVTVPKNFKRQVHISPVERDKLSLRVEPSNVVWFNKFPMVGFANTVFQFLFAKYLERTLGCHVVLGDVNNLKEGLSSDLFQVANQSAATRSLVEGQIGGEMCLGKNRLKSPELDVDLIREFFNKKPGSLLQVEGYFQYHTNWLRSVPDYRAAFDENLSLSHQNTKFQKTLRSYQVKIQSIFKSKYLLGIHVRRGDYLDFIDASAWQGQTFFTLKLDGIINRLAEFLKINEIKNALIYVASDDPDYCESYFSKKGIKIITARQLKLATPLDVNGLLLTDLAALCSARLLVASNSSLSLIASLLNDHASVFWRQTKEGETLSFDPWSTPVLYGLSEGL